MVDYLSGGRIQGSSESGYPDGLSTLADLTATGTISYTTGLAGKCIHCNFSGSESQGGTPAGNFFGQARTNTDDFNFIHTGGQAWTINFWIKPDSASLDRVSQLIGNMSYDGSSLSGFAFRCLDRRTQYGEENRFTTVFENNGNIVYSAFNGADGNIPDNTNWHMITVRCNGTNTSGATAIDICIDGGTNNNDFTTPQGTCTRSANTCNDRNASYGLMFGRNLYNQWGGADAYYNWDGSFDEVSIWNRELSDSECVALYNSGSGAVTTTAVTNHSGLKAYWNFNDQMENQAKPVDEKDSLTNVPANTRYEETDTRKIYRRVVSETIWEENATASGGEQCVNQSGWQNYNGFKVPSSLAGKKVKTVVAKLWAQGSSDQSPTGTVSAHIYNGTTLKAQSATIATSTLNVGTNLWTTGGETTCTFQGGTLSDYTLQTDDYVVVVGDTARTSGGYIQMTSTDSQGSGTNRWYRTSAGSWTEDTNNTMYMTVTSADGWTERNTA